MKTLDDLRLPDSAGTEKKLTKKSRDRILRVVEYIRNGYSRQRIMEELQKTEGISETQAKRYYNCTIDYLEPDENEQSELRISIINTLQNVIEKGIMDGDKSATTKALDLLAKISGNMTQKVDLNTDIKINFDIDTEPDNEDNGENN